MADSPLSVPGPVDSVVLEFPDEASTSRVVEHLSTVVQAGLIRLYDVLALRKDADGSVREVPLTDVGAGVGFARFAGAQSSLLDDEDAALAGATIDAGNAGVVLVYENSWCSPLATSIYESGGDIAATFHVPITDLLSTLDEGST